MSQSLTGSGGLYDFNVKLLLLGDSGAGKTAVSSPNTN
jgi:GTPase SAR1 family protein